MQYSVFDVNDYTLRKITGFTPVIIYLPYTEFKARGANIIDSLEDTPWNTRQFTLQDLNGHIFYIYNG